jgi:hypothetical protein
MNPFPNAESTPTRLDKEGREPSHKSCVHPNETGAPSAQLRQHRYSSRPGDVNVHGFPFVHRNPARVPPHSIRLDAGTVDPENAIL